MSTEAGIELSKVKAKEIKEAITVLNDSGLLDRNIQIKGRKARSLAISFCKAVEKLDDDGKLDDLPSEAFEYYGSIVPGDDDTEEETEEETEPKAKEKAKAKAKAKPEKPAEKVAGRKATPTAKIGVIGTILKTIQENGPVTRKQIMTKLKRSFPDRDEDKMSKTMMCQIGGKKRPLRLEREKKIKFDIDDAGKYTIKEAKKKRKAA
jgi:hypothetical protein